MADPIYVNESDEIQVHLERKNATSGAVEPASGLTTLTAFYSASSGGTAIDATLSKAMTERTGAPGNYVANIPGAAKAAHLTVGQAAYARITDSASHLSLSRPVVVRQVRSTDATTVPGTGIVTIVTAPPPPPPPPDVVIDTTPASVTIGSSSVSLLVGGTSQLTAVIKNAAGGVLALSPTSWTSSDNTIATVDSSGLVTAVVAGSASITAHYNALPSNPASATITSPVVPPVAGSTDRGTDLPLFFIDSDVADTPCAGSRVIVCVDSVDLTAALAGAVPGDRITLTAGNTFTGNFAVNAGGVDGNWVWIETTGSKPAEHTRWSEDGTVDKATFNPPIVQSNNNLAALAINANYVRVMGLEVTVAGSVTGHTDGIVRIGNGDETTLAALPHDIVVDRNFIHGHTTLDARSAVRNNGARVSIIDNCINEMHSTSDAQGVSGWNGGAGHKIVNNFIQASGETIAYGGADPTIPDTVWSDVEIRGNHLKGKAAWAATWNTKNLLELKIGRRVLIEGNVMEDSWPKGQIGYAFVLWSVHQNGNAPWSVTEHVTVRKNVMRNVTACFNLEDNGVGESGYNAPPMNHIAIHDNVAIGVDATQGSTGILFQMGGLAGSIANLVIEHNTAFSPNDSSFKWSGGPFVNHVIQNNLVGGGNFIIFTSAGVGSVAWDSIRGANSVFLGNIVEGYPSDFQAIPGNSYPSDFTSIGLGDASKVTSQSATLADLTLSPTSSYLHAGTNGATPGADMVAVAVAVSGVGGGF